MPAHTLMDALILHRLLVHPPQPGFRVIGNRAYLTPGTGPGNQYVLSAHVLYGTATGAPLGLGLRASRRNTGTLDTLDLAFDPDRPGHLTFTDSEVAYPTWSRTQSPSFARLWQAITAYAQVWLHIDLPSVPAHPARDDA